MIITNDILAPNRRGFVTGSRVSVLFPKKSAEVGQRQYAKQLANERYWGYYDETSTWQTEHGNMNEFHAENHYSQYYGHIGERPKFIADDINQIGGSPDWVGLDHGCDWKCPTTLQGWLDYIYYPIDDSQYYQCQTYMHLTGLKLWKICAYLTETNRMIDNGIMYPVAEQDRMIIIEVPYLEGFGEMLIERSKPIIKMRDEFIEVLVNRFGRPATEREKAEKMEFDIDHNESRE